MMIHSLLFEVRFFSSAWLKASAEVFGETIRTVFKGKHVYHVSISSMQGQFESKNPHLHEVSKVLFHAWNPNKPEYSNWRSIDQWSINAGKLLLLWLLCVVSRYILNDFRQRKNVCRSCSFPRKTCNCCTISNL